MREAMAAAKAAFPAWRQTPDAGCIFEFIEGIETGVTHVNSATVGGEPHIPFGAIKDAGAGPREVRRTALDFYTDLKTLYIDYTGRKRESGVYECRTEKQLRLPGRVCFLRF